MGGSMPSGDCLSGLAVAVFEDGTGRIDLGTELEDAGSTVHRVRLGQDGTDPRPVERFISEVLEGEYDDVVFSNAQGVRLVCEFARQLGKLTPFIEALRSVRLLARGRRTARALAEFGLHPSLRTPTEDPDELRAFVREVAMAGRLVALQPLRSEEAEVLVESFGQSGASVRVVSNAMGVDVVANELIERLEAGTLDAIVFASVSQVTWLFDSAQVSGRSTDLDRGLRAVTVIAVEAAAEALRQRGYAPRLVAARSLAVASGREIADVLSGNMGEARPEARRGRRHEQRIVVVGNGMVSHKFCETLSDLDPRRRLSITVLGEERLPAYDRVNLTSYFSGKPAEDLLLADEDWYRDRGVRLRLDTRVARIDRFRRTVILTTGEQVPFDVLVLATGSAPFVPPVPGLERPGVFVYRTLDDLDAIRAYASKSKRAAVIGGGLLGLEAAKAVHDQGLETHVVEFAARLMPRQLDASGAGLLARRIRELGVEVHLGKKTTRVTGEARATGLRFSDGGRLDVDLVIVSAGIRPRDELARDAGLLVGERGGVVVDDRLRSSDPQIFAIGECAVHRGNVYGLVAPGYEQARALARGLAGEEATFTGADTSTKLKLLGVDVASFGDPFLDETTKRSIVYEDLLQGIFKKLVLSDDGRQLVGGILVGDASQFASLVHVMRSRQQLPERPETLILGQTGLAGGGVEIGDGAQICSCNAVDKAAIVSAVKDGAHGVDAVKRCTKAGTGCGGCVPMVTDIVTATLRAVGKAVKPRLCEHFDYTRQELFEIVRVKGIRTFPELVAQYGTGSGCEVCKPTAASILASTYNEPILNHGALQDTNDRFLANIQRGGLYSVVPRVPAGEITPDKLIKLGEVAKRYGLYTKITGGQRVDLFGAKLSDLPRIWEELIQAGFESGHAYGKAMRTVKSCVGSTWCRYGVQDSVALAIRIEHRYKGIRAPHKLKSAVSGCIRECAEAQGKDFGLIATEQGYNLYVCGNGGAKPRHADLLASDVDADTAIRYIDRFLMFYIRTADKLTRTSVWLDKMEGGLEHLRAVIVDDSLGICEQLEKDMTALVASYQCEWAGVVADPEKRSRFRVVSGQDPQDHSIELVEERGQRRPASWPNALFSERANEAGPHQWVRAGAVSDFPEDAGLAIVHGDRRIAVFNFASRGEWYAVDNRCPHMGDQVLARGILGDQCGTPKVACPMHKKTFSLESGRCLTDEEHAVATYPVRVEEGEVFVELPGAASDLISPDRLTRRQTAATAAE